MPSILSPRSEVEYTRILVLAFGRSGPPFPEPIAAIQSWPQSRRVVLRAAMRRALELSGMDEDDARKLVKRTVLLDARSKQRKVRGPTEEEGARILAAADAELPAHRAMVRVLVYMGLRSDSLLNLERSDVERALKAPHVLVFRQKGGSDVSLPAEFVQPELKTLLSTPKHGAMEVAWQRVGDILSPSESYGGAYMALWRLVKGVGVRAGLDRPLAPHALRHLFASWFQAQTGDIYLTMQALIHKSLNTTLKYVDADQRKLLAAMRPPAALRPPEATT